MTPPRKTSEEAEPMAAESVDEGALPGYRWPESAWYLGYAPEIIMASIEPDKFYTQDEVETAIKQFLARPVN